MESTEKLYYENNRSIAFEARILKQYQEKKIWVIILDKTLFYPEGGGQPADKGWLNDITVINVIKKEEFILHYVNEEIRTEKVSGKINWSYRYDFMQQHTGQHLISGAFWTVGKFKTVSVNMSVSYTTIEVEAKNILEEDLIKIEKLANEMILKNMPVKNIIIDSSKLAQYKLRRACSIKGEVRLIKLGEFDCVACGGIHLDFTGQVRLVKIIKIEKIRGNVRVYWKIGDRTFLDYYNKTEIIAKLKIALNSDEENLNRKVVQLKEEISEKNLKNKNLEKTIVGLYKNNLLINKDQSEGCRIIVEKWNDENEQIILSLTKTIMTEQNVIVCFINKTEKNIKWIIGCSEEINLNFINIKENLLKPFNCRGGGKHPIWQGVGETKLDEDKFFKKFESLVG